MIARHNDNGHSTHGLLRFDASTCCAMSINCRYTTAGLNFFSTRFLAYVPIRTVEEAFESVC